MRRGPVTLAAMVGAMSAAASAKEHVQYKPTGPWAMEYADHSCRLIRNFTDGSEGITLAFEKFGPGVPMQLGLAGNVRAAWPGETEARLRYEPGGESRKSDLLRAVLADGRESILFPSASLVVSPEDAGSEEDMAARERRLAEDEIAAAARLDTVVIEDGLKGAPEIQLGLLGAPMAAMRACLDDLVQSWGIDPAKLAKKSRAAQGLTPRDPWLLDKDYPKDMIRAGKGGYVTLILIIDEKGVVDGCHVAITQPGPFEDVACKGITERARFSPSLDAEGKPMRSVWIQSVRFGFAR